MKYTYSFCLRQKYVHTFRCVYWATKSISVYCKVFYYHYFDYSTFWCRWVVKHESIDHKFDHSYFFDCSLFVLLIALRFIILTIHYFANWILWLLDILTIHYFDYPLMRLCTSVSMFTIYHLTIEYSDYILIWSLIIMIVGYFDYLQFLTIHYLDYSLT